jgi:hypothetical protein
MSNSTNTPALSLSRDEVRLVLAHRQLQSGSQNSALRYMETFAAMPDARRRIAPCLRIVGGGAA